MSIPFWAVVPKHSKKVVATERGWVVEETGELLVSLRGLASRLKNYLKETSELKDHIQEVVQTAVVEEPVIDLTNQDTPVAQVEGPKQVVESEGPVEVKDTTVVEEPPKVATEEETPEKPVEVVTQKKKAGRKSNAERAAIAAAEAAKKEGEQAEKETEDQE